MQPSWYEEPRNRMRERSVGVLALIGLASFVAIAGVIFAYYFLPNPDLLFGSNESDTRTRKLLHVVLEDAELLVPSNLIARVKKRTMGRVQQVDLEMPWPFDPNAEIAAPEEITDHSNQLILTFMPTPLEPSVAERFAGIYKPYLSGAPARMTSGLQRYSFATSSPYADIEYYVGKSGNTAIYIKCELRASSLGPKLCSHTMKASALTSLRYRFARHHLSQWREIDRTARHLLSQILHLRRPAGQSG